MAKIKKVIIFDTTLRDGEQSPGASLTPEQKLTIAQQLARLGVDIIEAGFPVSSKGDFDAVSMIAKKIHHPIICALARAVKQDIDTCARALKGAHRKRIHTFIATSHIHMKYKLHKTQAEVLELVRNAIRYCRKFTDDVEFSPEDATRTDIDFLCKVVELAIKEGATTINIPDTVGYALPDEFGWLINTLVNKVPNIHKAILSVHCHNDLGLAVANSLSAITNGAQQVECTINGIGERAGNASLEEIVMALVTRKPLLGLSCTINTKEIYRTSRLVSTLTGLPVQPNKAIIGANAFAHEAGIHQDGIIKKRLTYEIMTPESVGIPASKLVLGKHSGRHAFSKRLAELGYKITKKALDSLFYKFKELADKKKYIFDADIVSLAEEAIGKTPEKYQMSYFHISSGSKAIPMATVKLSIRDNNKVRYIQEAGYGDGPIDAAYSAINKMIDFQPRLIDYSLRSISGGKEAQGEAIVRLEYKNTTFTGKGTSTDIIEASIKAYLSALNRISALSRKIS